MWAWMPVLVAGSALGAVDSATGAAIDAGVTSTMDADGGAALVTGAGGSPDAGAAVESIALLGLEGNEGGKGQTAPVGALIAARLSEGERLKVITQQDISAAISMERQKQLLGTTCTEDSACLAELSGALGARYLVTGRLDRFGSKYVLTASLFDSQRATVLARPHREAEDDSALPDAASSVAQDMLVALGRGGGSANASASASPDSDDTGADIGLRIGNNFISGLSSLSPAGDLVLGYRFDPAWVGFLQVGFSYARSAANDPAGNLSILPTVLGARHLYRVDKSVQPYWGVGLGVQLAIGQFGIFKEEGGTLPSVIGLVGVHWFLTRSFAVGIEGSSNLAQTVLGLSGRNTDLGTGFNLKPSLSVTFRP